jgi:Ca2+-binding RTX toxin-like protein
MALFSGTENNDTLIGGSTSFTGSNDTLVGGNGNDALLARRIQNIADGSPRDFIGWSNFIFPPPGSPGFNSVFSLDGGNGDDFFGVAIGVDDIMTLDGGAGTDVILGAVFPDVTTPIVLDLDRLPANLSSLSTTFKAPNLSNISNVESIFSVVTRDGDDVISISRSFDGLLAGVPRQIGLRGGNDKITISGDATATVTGDNGNDTLIGGNGNDILHGDELLPHPSGDETGYEGYLEDFLGGNGNDSVNGGGGDDLITGGAGIDRLDGGEGSDTLYSGSGNDTISGGNGNDFAFGGTGDDSLSGGLGIDNFEGNLGNDTIQGEDGDDGLAGQEGDDSLLGGAGNDRLYGWTGNDILNGDAGDDNLYADDGNDTLNGGSGSDNMYGGLDSDVLFGGDDIDNLEGGSGNDTLRGGKGNDILSGEGNNNGIYYVAGVAGADTFAFDSLSGAAFADLGVDRITDFQTGTDKILLDQSIFTALPGALTATSFQVVANITDAATSTGLIVYSQGQLFYNANGAAAGYGTGGVFATFDNPAPTLAVNDFMISGVATGAQ